MNSFYFSSGVVASLVWDLKFQKCILKLLQFISLKALYLYQEYAQIRRIF